MSYVAIFIGPRFVGDRWKLILLQLRLNAVNLEYLTTYISVYWAIRWQLPKHFHTFSLGELSHTTIIRGRCRPDIEAQQQCYEDSRYDNVTKAKHCKVVGRKSFLKQVLWKHHWSTQVHFRTFLTATTIEDSSLLLVLAHQRIRGFAFMRYINPRLTLTLTTTTTS